MEQNLITAEYLNSLATIGDVRVSPDGRLIAFNERTAERLALMVIETAAPNRVVAEITDPKPAPAHPSSGGVIDWLPDSDSLIYATSSGALVHYLLDDGIGNDDGVGTDDANHTVVHAHEHPVANPTVSPDGTRLAFVSDTATVGLLSLVENEAHPHRLATQADFCYDPVWSPDGRWLVWHEWDVPAMPWDAGRIVAHDSHDLNSHPIVVCSFADAAVGQPRFDPTGEHLYFTCDQGGFVNIWRCEFDPAAESPFGECAPLIVEPYEHGDPGWGAGRRSFAFVDSGEIVFTRRVNGGGELCVFDPISQTARVVADGVFACLSTSGSTVLATYTEADTPYQIVAVDIDQQSITKLRDTSPVDLEPATLARPLHVMVDYVGGSVHTQIYLPATAGDGEQVPTIVWVHGGPTDQARCIFNPRVQYFVQRGWAVVMPDYRGSSGWGRDYMLAMRGRWGEIDIEDSVAVAGWVSTQSWSDGTIVAMGGSAGGLTVLGMGARLGSELDGVIALYPVTDIGGLFESTHRFEAHYDDTLLGPLPDREDIAAERSPLGYADQIVAPVLLLHGDKDDVVPLEQSYALRSAIAESGGEVTIHVYAGEGHGWSNPATTADEIARVEDFLSGIAPSSAGQ